LNTNIEKLLALAEQGDSTAQKELADSYYEGKGVEENFEKAFELYSKIVEQGDPEVQRKFVIVMKSLKKMIKRLLNGTRKQQNKAIYMLNTN